MMELSRQYPNLIFWLEMGNLPKILEGWGLWSKGMYPTIARCSFTHTGSRCTFTDDEMMLVDALLAQIKREGGVKIITHFRLYYISGLTLSSISKLLHQGKKTTQKTLDLGRHRLYDLLCSRLQFNDGTDTEQKEVDAISGQSTGNPSKSPAGKRIGKGQLQSLLVRHLP